MPGISIIVPFWEGNALLSDFFSALSSLDRSGAGSVEVIIGDDGSPEAPDPATWRGLDIPVRVFSQEHKGQSAATNLAAKHASGDLLWFLDQDIRPSGSALAEMLSKHTQHPSALVQGWIDHDPELLKDRFTRFITLDTGYQFAYDLIDNDDNLLPFFHYAPHALVAKESYLKIGGYDEALPFGYQDTDFALRWMQTGGRIVLARQSKVLHAHKFEIWSYLHRMERIGRAWVYFTLKYQPPAQLDLMKPTLRLYLIDFAKAVSHARRMVSIWEATGMEPEGAFVDSFSPRGEKVVPALDAAFHLLLDNAHMRGIYEGMKAAGLEFRLIDVPSPSSGTHALGKNIVDWVIRMAGGN